MLSGQRSQVDLDLLVAAEHAYRRVEATPWNADLSPTNRLPVSCEENLKQKKKFTAAKHHSLRGLLALPPCNLSIHYLNEIYGNTSPIFCDVKTNVIDQWSHS